MNIDRIFKDEISDEARERMLKGWKKAVGRSFDWNEEV
jgi:glycerol kinase